jgi:hypothetical protein
MTGRLTTRTDHILIESRRYSNILYVRRFRRAYRDTDQNLMVTKFRERFAVKQRAQAFDGKKFYLGNLNELEVR